MAQEDTGACLAWFLLGATLGAVGALLLAPQTGSETREMVRKRALEGRDALGRTGREVYERGREVCERGKNIAEDASELYEKGRDVVSRVKTTVTNKPAQGSPEEAS